MATLTAEISGTYSPATFAAFRSAISSLASAGGHTRFVLRGGPTTEPSGQDLARVSRSRVPTLRMEAPRVKTTIGTSGPTSTALSLSAALQSSLVSRLKEQFLGAGSTKCSGTWKQITTPAGRMLDRLYLSARDMKGNGFIGWPTPTARDGRDISRSTAFLSARERHAPSMATRLLERGAPWTAITPIYCLAMGYPSHWNALRPVDTVTRSSRKSRQSSSKQRT